MSCCSGGSRRFWNIAIAVCAATDDRTPFITRISVFIILFMVAMVMVVTVVMVAIMLVIVMMVMVMIMVVIVIIFMIVIADMAVVLYKHLILMQVFPIIAVLIVRWQTGRRWVRRERD